MRYFSLIICFLFISVAHCHTVVAIDAGHGGKDSGTVGKVLYVKEKDVTLSIAKELKKLLDLDSDFKAIMIRTDDYYIKVPKRSEIARKYKANYLISIHADASATSKVKGAAVWVLSNQRSNNELDKWLENSEKQSELLGGVGEVLSNSNDPYLNQIVLDLQFSYSKKSGYELARVILQKLSQIAPIVKTAPHHASYGVLKAPDIPSILIETGFLSNEEEERKLATLGYRKKLAKAIYAGLVEYNKSQKKGNTTSSTQPINNNLSDSKTNKKSNNSYHIVKKNETLYSISKVYNTTPERLIKLNQVKNNKIFVGQKLKIE